MSKVKAYAGYGKDQPVKPFEYVPRTMGDYDVEIQVECTGICGSDIHTLDSGWGPTAYPVVVGHEIVGKVTKRGPKVPDEVQIGTRVGVGAMVHACLKDTCYECSHGLDQICPKSVGTYNSKWPDGSPSYGGYGESVRVDGRYAFPLPANLPSHQAAPLLCAGITTFAPLKRHGCGPGKNVGVVGVGGLGHLGIMFAKALGADVYAVSHSPGKSADAKKLGCTDVLLSEDLYPPKKDANGKRPVWKWRNFFDILLITSNATDPKYWQRLLLLVKPRGTAIMVGAPEAPMSIPAFGLIGGERTLTGSSIGSRADVLEMLKVASEKNIQSWVQVFPMPEVNKAIQKVRDNNIKFRAVLDVANWKKTEFEQKL